MKILLLGHSGQVGTELKRTLLPLGTIVTLGRSECDFTNLPALMQTLQRLKLDVIVNAAAYTAVDRAESDRENAFLVNAEAVKVLATHAAQRGILLVHYSTDYVFDGGKRGAYLETDLPNPKNVYGESKLAGEQAVLESGAAHLIFRTSWVFSKTGHHFIKTILKLAAERAHLRVVADQVGAPTSAELIADVTTLAIYAHRRQQLASGLYHLTAAGQTTWHALATHVVERAKAAGAPLMVQQIEAIETKDYPVPALRPQNSVLGTKRLSKALQIHLPDWSVYVDRL